VHHGDVLSLQQGAPNKHGNGKRRAASHGGHAHLGFTAAGNKFVDLRQAKVPPHAACLCMPLPAPSYADAPCMRSACSSAGLLRLLLPRVGLATG
tara:strand:- start:680 stop:964 length:285 start_codon:yes stop_codon:yes gene_type:complete